MGPTRACGYDSRPRGCFQSESRAPGVLRRLGAAVYRTMENYRESRERARLPDSSGVPEAG